MLKFIEENYPLPDKPEPPQGLCMIFFPSMFFLFGYNSIYFNLVLFIDESVKELQRKRHSATPGISSKGRVRKIAKWKPDSDEESFGESESECIYEYRLF